MKEYTREDRLSIYVHIPYCVRKCAYCDFASGPYLKEEAERYLSALEKEILASPFAGGHVSTLFFGGGTPSLLSPEQLDRILKAIGRRFPFEGDAEITLEANPGTVTKDSLLGYRRAGANRISLGVQAMQDHLLKAIGRIHTAEEGAEAVALAKAAGFSNINVDLMYGLPGQTAGDLIKSVSWAADAGAGHISAYALILEEDTPLFGAHSRGDVVLPGEDAEIDMEARMREALKDRGYRRYEISNYAKPGRECRHNLVYWRRGQYLGFGAAAHSLMGEVRFANTGSAGEYIRRMEGGQSPQTYREQIAAKDARFEALMLGLRMTEGVSLPQMHERYGLDLARTHAREIEELSAQGLLRVEDGRMFLTDAGLNVQNSVLMRFMD